MNHNQPHEPETKGSNKTRDFQDRLARLIKDGVQTKSEAAPSLIDWFLDASKAQQIEFMEWAAGYWWPVMEGKIERLADPLREAETFHAPAPVAPRRIDPVLSPDRRAKIAEQVRVGMHQQWINVISNMTGALVRAAKMLPDEMADQVGDDQRVGDVFTAEQLMQAKRV